MLSMFDQVKQTTNLDRRLSFGPLTQRPEVGHLAPLTRDIPQINQLLIEVDLVQSSPHIYDINLTGGRRLIASFVHFRRH